MKKYFLILMLIFIGMPHSISAAEACSIEKGPPKELTTYMTRVRTELEKIKAEAGGGNKCSGAQGTFSSERRFLETIDRIDTQVFAWSDVVANFMYSVTYSVDGRSHGPVITQGGLWKNLEQSAILPSLQSISRLCLLDTPLASGGTPESRIGTILKTHRLLERYFWQVSLGDPTPPDGLETYQSLLIAIRDNYSPEVTKKCKTDSDIPSIVEKLTDKIGKLTRKTEKAHTSWEDAIALFRGTTAGSADYEKLQARLLQTELARQGLSANAKKAILGKLSCIQGRTNETSSIEDMGKSSFECTNNLYAGLETLTRGLRFPLNFSRTSDAYIWNAMNYSREQSRATGDMGAFWKTLETLKTDDEVLNEKIITDLVNLHGELSTLSDTLGKKVLDMIENCRKGNPEVQCPSPPTQ